MAFHVNPTTADVRLGATVKLTYTADPPPPPPAPPAPAPPPPPTASWRVAAGGAGTIDADGTYHAPTTRPAQPTQVVELVAAGAVVGQVTLTFVVPWPADWPYLDDGGDQAWDPVMREWLARALYDLLSHLPADTVRRMGRVPVVRINGTTAGAQYNPYHLFAGRVEITESTVNADFGATPAAPDDWHYRDLGDTLVHELAHSIMAQQCGATFGVMGETCELIGALLGGIASQGLAIASFFVFPLIPFELAFGFGGAAVDAAVLRDAMSPWGEATGWVTHNFAAMKIPLLGFVLPWITTAPPNYATGGRAPAIFGLRNIHVGPASTYEALTALPEGADKRAAIEAAMTLTGASTAYAMAAAHEDFAESMLAMIAGDTNVVHLDRNTPARPISAARRAYITDRGILPATWTTPVAPARTYDRAHFAAWKIDATPPATVEAAAIADPRAKLAAVQAAWAAHAGPLVERNLAVARRILPTGAQPSVIQLARTAERHGAGLARYAGVEHAVAKGDLLIARDAQLWMATGVDDRGRLVHATGQRLARGATQPAPIARDGLVYQWAPSDARRVFATAETASPHYPDLEAALHTLIELWGEDHAADHGPLGTVASYLRAVLAIAGLAGDDGALAGDAHHHALAHMHSHGAGLVPYEVGRDRVRVGDVLVPYHGNTLAVVTRVDRDGRPVDVLHGGTWRAGAIGEPAGAVQLEHAVDPLDFHLVWSPSARPRAWLPLEAPMPAVFTDANAALGHVLRQTGEPTFVRGEHHRDASSLGTAQLLVALLIERGATDAARAQLGPLGFDADDGMAAWNHLITHGALTSQAPVTPGQLVLWRGQGPGSRGGLVLAVDASGAPTEVITHADDSRTLIRRTGTIPLAQILAAATLGLEPRPAVTGDAARAFDGTPSTLAGLIQRRRPSVAWEEHVVDGDKLTLFFGHAQDRARLLALGAPAWVRTRIAHRTGLDGVRAAVDTLGDGVRAYSGGPVPVGAWLFLRGDDFGVVLATTPTGAPGLMIANGGNSFDFTAVDPAAIVGWWAPSAEPRRYTELTCPEAYADLNRELGNLRLWAWTSSDRYQEPLFRHAGEYPDSTLLPAIQAILRGASATDANDWLAVLNGYGDGVMPGAPQPGDFVFLDGGGLGIALDHGELLTWRSPRLQIVPLAGVRALWRPSARKR